MTIEFRLPDLGEDTTEGEVVRVLVKPGDLVQKDQTVLELETDKALLEVPSPAAGRIASVAAREGGKLKVADLILTIEEDRQSDGMRPEARPKEAPKAREGERKAEAPSKPKQKEAPKTGAKPAAAGREAESSEPAEKEEAKPEPEVEEREIERPAARVLEIAGAGKAVAAPSTRKLARELGVDLAQVAGSGPAGRITPEDVRNHVRARVAAPGTKGAPSAVPFAVPPLPDFSQWGEIERQPMSGIRRRTLEHLWVSWSQIPHVTQVDEADITDLMALRERHAQRAREKGGKLTVTVFVVKAVVSALKEHAQFNASVDVAREELILKRYYHLGVAVDTPFGLLVPVIRDVDKKDVLDLSAELLTLSERARTRKVKPEELKGSTFTITNLGGLGGTAFTPIIHHPEVAILGLAQSQKRLVMTPDGIKERIMLPLCLSYDHRVIDGADAVRFTRKVASMLEDPALLLLQS